MRLKLDPDGATCALIQPRASQGDVKRLPGAVEWFARVKAPGHDSIIHSARHTKPWNRSIGKEVTGVGEMPFNWLKEIAL